MIKKNKPPAIFILILVTLSTQTWGVELPVSIASVLNKSQIPQQSVSLEILELESDKNVISLQADKPRHPASVIKLLTTLVSLELLGPAYLWKTRYLINGVVENDVLLGDLIMQGSGDPYLTQEQMWAQLLALRKRGLKEIKGDLVIDNTLFKITKYDRATFDGKPERLYNVGPDAALVNFSASQFVLYPVGNLVNVFADPPLVNMKIENNIRAGKGRCANWMGGWNYSAKKQGNEAIVRFNGNYKTACGVQSFSRSVFDNHA